MKLLTFTLLAIWLAIQAHCQGVIAFNNFTPALAPVAINSAPGMYNPSDGPAGAFVGSNYTASLLFVNGTVTDLSVFDSSNPIWMADARFLGTTGTAPDHGWNADGAGFFEGGEVRLVGQTDFNITVQVRAWYNGGGLYASYAQALAAGHNVGQSNLLPLYVTLPPGPDANLDGLQPFTVGIPEPSTFVLAALGGAALLLFRRRK